MYINWINGNHYCMRISVTHAITYHQIEVMKKDVAGRPVLLYSVLVFCPLVGDLLEKNTNVISFDYF